MEHNTDSRYIVLHAGNTAGFNIEEVELNYFDTTSSKWIHFESSWEYFPEKEFLIIKNEDETEWTRGLRYQIFIKFSNFLNKGLNEKAENESL